MKTLDLDDAALLAPVTADVFGKPVDLVYRADRYTPELLTRDDLTLQGLVVELVAEWGLTRGGEPVPLTPEGVATLATPILARVWDAIRSDFDPNPEWSAGSDSISTPAVEEATAP